jgi:hypothetical protein
MIQLCEPDSEESPNHTGRGRRGNVWEGGMAEHARAWKRMAGFPMC